MEPESLLPYSQAPTFRDYRFKVDRQTPTVMARRMMRLELYLYVLAREEK
jgi:hypothetical protein